VEVHLPLILRISGENLHCDAINPIKKFVKVVSVKLSKVDGTPLLRYIFFGDFILQDIFFYKDRNGFELEMLSREGTFAGLPYVKHIEGDI
jgi:hypothetical protein